MRLTDADALIAPLKKEYKRLKQAFNETSVFQAPNDVELYGALMQEVGAVIGTIEKAPTVDAEPVRHGKWELAEDGWYCSACELYPPFDCDPEEKGIPYCPYCGARMDEERKER